MRRVIVDTDTAGDDTQALALAVLSDRLSVEAVTVVAGNALFDRQVENAKYTLSLVDRTEIPVYEGARQPLCKSHEHATEIHGEGGLGGDLFPETGIDSADGFGPDEIVRRCRDSPGELTLLCIGPLTNLALAHAREPDLPDLVDEVWVMGGAVNCRGNVTPAAEFNFWVDPDAAARVVDEFDVTLVDWGLSLRTPIDAASLNEISAFDTPLADFFLEVTNIVRERGEAAGLEGITQPDGLTTALLAYPELRDQVTSYAVAVDDREGLTRGYSSVDVEGVTGDPADTRVVEAADADKFRDMILGMLRDRDPDGAFD